MRQMARVIALFVALGGGAGTGAQTAFAQQAPDPRVADLVAAGKLRVAIGLGTPALAIKDATTGEPRGPAMELGRALAARIGVAFTPIEYQRPGTILDGAATTAWDVAFLVIHPVRAEKADFSQPYMQSDFTYLVPAGSSIRSVADVDKPGIRIAVPRGDASDLELTRVLRRAELVRTESLEAASELVRSGQADVRASPRVVLLAESARLPGSRVLDEGFAPIAYGALVPKGQAGRLAYIDEFIDEAKASSLIERVIESAGLRGIRAVPARKAAPE